jgi:hypothetical protein
MNIITKNTKDDSPAPFEPTITRKHYTTLGEHPEDRIYADKQHIQRLNTYINSIIFSLADSLRLTMQAEETLKAFLNDPSDLSFEEYLEDRNIRYEDLVCQNNHYVKYTT